MNFVGVLHLECSLSLFFMALVNLCLLQVFLLRMFFFRAVVQLSSPGSAPSPTLRWLPTMSPALMMELLNWCLWFQCCIFNHFNTRWSTSYIKVPMGEDVLTNGRPADGIYFLTTNGEEPRSYNSYEQWTENWNVWNINSFRRFQHLHKSALKVKDR